jgi:superfamily II DNA or RNA helicase
VALLDLSNLEYAVTKSVRNRGADYARDSAVTLDPPMDGAVTATVLGATLYTVVLRYEPGALKAGCSCPHFQQNAVVCKHIWAVVVECTNHNVEFPGPVDNLTVDDEFIDPDFDDDFEFELPPPPPLRPLSVPRGNVVAIRRPWVEPSRWRSQIRGLPSIRDEAPEVPGEITWVLVSGMSDETIAIEIATRKRKKNGELGAPQPLRIAHAAIPLLPSADREILAIITGKSWAYGTADSRFSIGWPLAEFLLPKLVATGRLMIRGGGECVPCTKLDEGEPWRLTVKAEEKQGKYVLVGTLTRAAESIPVTSALTVTRGGFVIFRDSIARFADEGTHGWAHLLARQEVEIPAEERGEFLQSVAGTRTPVHIAFPDDVAWEEKRVPPRATLELHAAADSWITCVPRFEYDGHGVDALANTRVLFDETANTAYMRDAAEEARLMAALWREQFLRSGLSVSLPAERVLAAIPQLIEAGWDVRGEDGVYAAGGALELELRSGIDWFDVTGTVSFGGEDVPLPRLLAALRKGEATIRLADGRLGMVSHEWHSQLEPFLAAASDEHGEGLRFRRNQVLLLDALLATRPAVSFDEVFDQARRRILDVKIVPEEPPQSFLGILRPYQREGLGWFTFLRDLGFGGCLADDMGLGKTIQVLALLDQRRRTDDRRPSLVVAPRSVVFNWKAEAARFTPELRMLDHSTPDRVRATDHFAQYDVVLTTYALLRKEVGLFDVDFDYVVLDEAQAIKNASSQAAKASTLLRARHRLALSGTPVENHLGELASLFEFLNPGMLRAKSSRVVKMLRDAGARTPEAEVARTMLARAVRPFILRRTKAQVAPELPERTEQTVWCELEPKQRKLYDELRDYYRAAVLGRVQTQGLNRSTIQILEALLRLRQAACHPALVDPQRTGESSAKLDTLFDELRILVDGGHKVLVFSQFTSLLSIVRKELEQRGVEHAYLDGSSRDREAQVRRFQSDPKVPLFLISLKAGGLGLNLTAAEYVFLLDPWWNPAVEAQAIDRAHRIGQTRNVFAYRLVARDTIEEKILQLQQSKRDLAAAIISEENSILRQLTAEDLDLLLS